MVIYTQESSWEGDCTVEAIVQIVIQKLPIAHLKTELWIQRLIIPQSKVALAFKVRIIIHVASSLRQKQEQDTQTVQHDLDRWLG